ncbi:MAG: hypothetical protein QOH61_2242 [Chloroflexota bacterium]|jgi:hypothetical protein|nr:hypothetical protein [Chloroflexota bacterium]
MRFSPVVDVRVSDELVTFVLDDGREVAAPTAWSKRLTDATDEQRRQWQIGGYGTEVSWSELDEDIGVWTLLGISEEALFEAAGFKAPQRAR